MQTPEVPTNLWHPSSSPSSWRDTGGWLGPLPHTWAGSNLPLQRLQKEAEEEEEGGRSRGCYRFKSLLIIPPHSLRSGHLPQAL